MAKGVRFILLFMIAAVIVSMTGVAVSYFVVFLLEFQFQADHQI